MLCRHCNWNKAQADGFCPSCASVPEIIDLHKPKEERKEDTDSPVVVDIRKDDWNDLISCQL